MAIKLRHPLPGESRSEARAVLRVSAHLLFRNAPPRKGKTLDVGPIGMALLMPEPASPGTLCGVRFNAMINGQIVKVESMARVVYCICVGTTGFRIGCQFTDMDADSRAAVGRITSGH